MKIQYFRRKNIDKCLRINKITQHYCRGGSEIRATSIEHYSFYYKGLSGVSFVQNRRNSLDVYITGNAYASDVVSLPYWLG